MNYCVIYTRQEINEIEKKMFKYIQTNCICCNFCFHCKFLINLKREISRVGFNSFNSDINYWSIDFKDYECNVRLKYYVLET